MADDGGGGGASQPNALPSLQNLNLSDLQKEHSKTVDKLQAKEKGFYCLDMHALKNAMAQGQVPPMHGEGCESAIYLIPGALNYPDSEPLMQEMVAFMSDTTLVPVSMSKPWNKPIARRQCTFGAHYKNFGTSFELTDQRVPQLVHRVYGDTVGLIANNPAVAGINPDEDVSERLEAVKEVFTGVHCNFYDGGAAYVPAHQDNEPDLDRTKPIFSYTFLKEKVAGRKVVSRQFNIYNQDPKQRQKGEPPIQPVARVLLGHGDLLIMAGRMQTYFWHEVPKAGEKTFANTQRINFTVRAFTPEAVENAKRAAQFREEAARRVKEADEEAASKAEAAAKAVAEVVPKDGDAMADS